MRTTHGLTQGPAKGPESAPGTSRRWLIWAMACSVRMNNAMAPCANAIARSPLTSCLRSTSRRRREVGTPSSSWVLPISALGASASTGAKRRFTDACVLPASPTTDLEHATATMSVREANRSPAPRIEMLVPIGKAMSLWAVLANGVERGAGSLWN